MSRLKKNQAADRWSTARNFRHAHMATREKIGKM